MTAYQESAAANDTKREIQRGNSNTKTRQLDAQIERLTLQHVKLQRTNRLLKVDTDNLIKQKTQPLEENVRQLTLANVQLQRAARLLQQDLEEKSNCLEKLKQEQITQMKSVGPEYEFLVQMINHLHRQVKYKMGKLICLDTGCGCVGVCIHQGSGISISISTMECVWMPLLCTYLFNLA